jgi:translin
MTEPGGLDAMLPAILEHFAAKNVARETALVACRRVIRLSALSIRAVHRREWETAIHLIAEAREVRDVAIAALAPHPDIQYAGFLHDAQKEFAEACTTLALVRGHELPSPLTLGVEYPAYLNGIAEAVGELRRMILDQLRTGSFEGCEMLLGAMDEIYSGLVTIDFPDAMTGNLRRTTDQTRGILEKTRGDLTMAILQRQVTDALGFSQTGESGPR